VCTLAFVCAAVFVSAGPVALRAPLVLERQAVLAGEWWRILSGHLWHGEAAFAAWDLGVLALLGAWVERRSRAELLAALGLGALFSGVAVLVLRPDLASYQGSSALASALLVTECLRLLGRGSDAFVRVAAALGLLFLAAKIAFESVGLWPSVALGSASHLESVAVAHLAGAVAGGLVRCGFDVAAQGRQRSVASS
jgi:rhomboid family GlyGly-CTERM serine protease